MAIVLNERAAGNQLLFREVNERVVALEQGGFQEVDGDGGIVHAICECASAACHEPVVLGIQAYTAIRSSRLRFLVQPGHEWLDVERVASQHEGYVVVERISANGEATELAGRSSQNGKRPADGLWACQELEVPRGLQRSLEDRLQAGDSQARLSLQVVVAFIAELENPRAAAPNV